MIIKKKKKKKVRLRIRIIVIIDTFSIHRFVRLETDRSDQSEFDWIRFKPNLIKSFLTTTTTTTISLKSTKPPKNK